MSDDTPACVRCDKPAVRHCGPEWGTTTCDAWRCKTCGAIAAPGRPWVPSRAELERNGLT